MLAARKEDCMHFVIFHGGTSGEYPWWFRSYMDDHIYQDEYRYSAILNTETDFRSWPHHLIEGWSVFLRNRERQIMETSSDVFEENFEVIAGTLAARKEDVIEYIVYTGEDGIYPDWFIEQISDEGVVSRAYNTLFYNAEDGEYALDPVTVFLHNDRGEIKPIQLSDFNRLFFSKQNYEII